GRGTDLERCHAARLGAAVGAVAQDGAETTVTGLLALGLASSCIANGRPGFDTPVARPGRPALRITSEPDQAGTRLAAKRCDRSITIIQHGCLINAVAAIFEGGREGACVRRIESLPR